MRKRTLAGRLLLFALLFLGNSTLMSARSQTNAWLTSYSQASASVMRPYQDQDGQARTISSVLAEARKIFDVDFIYESKVIPSTKVIIDVDKYKSVEDFLDELLKPYNLKYKKVLSKAYVIYTSNPELKRLIASLIKEDGLSAAMQANTNSDSRNTVVVGQISDDKGPLEGVSVIIKGTNKGTLTDKEGHFRIEVDNSNAVLVFSLIGYQTREEPIGGRSDLSLVLTSKSEGLNDVVVVGYGTQKKSVVTGAITSVKASDLEDQPVNRLEDALQGRTSGVMIAANSGQPGSTEQVRVRGTTSINAGSDPLYVIDGVPLDGGGLDYLNPADIESIEVLKDAASQAIYGARAATGVILVTTKKGKSGQMRVSYEGYAGTQAPARKLHLLDAQQYATLRNESSLAGGKGVVFSNPASLGRGTDWQGQIFDNHASENSSQLSFSGGTDKSTFYTSLGYFDQNGIVADPISWYKRVTARFNGSHKMTPWLSFGENIGYSYIRDQGLGNTNSEFGGPLSSAINLDPTTPVVITDPNVLNDPSSIYNTEPVIRNAAGQPYAISNYVGQEETNPLAYIATQKGNNYNWGHNIVADGYLGITPIKGLELKTSVGTKLAFWGSNSFTPIFYLNGSTSNTITNYYRDAESLFIWNWENTASYNRHFGLHNITALIGTSAWASNRGNGINGNFQYMPVTSLSQATPNYSLPNADRVASGYDNVNQTIASEFARVVYNYDERYLLEGQIRRDGSTQFGPNHKYGYFPGGSIGWVVSREQFMADNNTISFLKIRGSYGVTGNDNIDPLLYESTVSGGRNYTFGNGYQIGYSTNAPANPDLKWEQTKQVDVGFDAVVFNNLNITFDAYNKTTDGLLMTEQLPLYVGASSNPTANIGNMSNKGLELEVRYTKKVGEVQLSVAGNGSLLRNRVTNMGVTPYQTGATLQSAAYELARTAPGYAIGSFYGFKTLGIFQTQADVQNYVNKAGQMIQPNAKPGDFKWADLDGDGAITAKDRTFIGDPTPHYTYGFTVTAAWRGFDIVVFGQGAGGNMIFQGLRRLDIQTANYSTKALGRWTGPGSTNSFPRLVDGDPNNNFTNPSAFYLEPGAYFRIKTLQIGYTLPKELLRRWTMQKIRIYVSGYNLLTFTHYTGYDPEIGGGKNTSIDMGFYPQARTLQAGLSVGF
ncbi:MAG TPA: SusC/RagA family TonB-linked outer membrane protein [Puia sp.]|nr:SusC/RagA family TonB-linked outer membrane protein [Puia sp.]